MGRFSFPLKVLFRAQTLVAFDLTRVRADLAVMRQAIGIGPPWSMADIWFHAALAAAGGLYALVCWPGAPWEISKNLGGVPILGILGAYAVYMAIKARGLPPRQASRRSEYRSTLVAMACIVPATLIYVAWGRRVGLTRVQSGGVVMAIIGLGALVVGIAQPSLRHPRVYYIAGAIPCVLFGLAIPLANPAYASSLIGLMDLSAVGAVAVVMYLHLRRQQADEGGHGGN
jgi:hypothetical protein